MQVKCGVLREENDIGRIGYHTMSMSYAVQSVGIRNLDRKRYFGIKS